jgi:hypothetical protein
MMRRYHSRYHTTKLVELALREIEYCYFVATQIICLKPINCIKLLAKGFKKNINTKSINRFGVVDPNLATHLAFPQPQKSQLILLLT